jgi:UDP-3-O-[3-hydroxymyristoyl] glucosamine N-acyltransferase
MFKNLSVEEIANHLNLSFIGKNKIIKGINTLKNASHYDLSFFSNAKYINDLYTTKAGACLVRIEDIHLMSDHITKIICKDPYNTYSYVLDLLVIDSMKRKISSDAYISQEAKIGQNCAIGPHCYIGDNVIIGNDVILDHNITLQNCQIGNNTIIHSGTRIGQDGFGFTLGIDGNMKKIKQLGMVIIGDNVEIGANTSIDRGSIDNTVIGDYTKIDNLVQIGHNVIIGKNCIICAQVGIAGSTNIGDYVMIGGQAGINGHISIGNKVQIAAKSGVVGDINDNAKVGGYPAINLFDWHKQNILLKHMLKQ